MRATEISVIFPLFLGPQGNLHISEDRYEKLFVSSIYASCPKCVKGMLGTLGFGAEMAGTLETDITFSLFDFQPLGDLKLNCTKLRHIVFIQKQTTSLK